MKVVAIESIDSSRTAIQIYLCLQKLSNEGIHVASCKASLNHRFIVKNIFSKLNNNRNVTLEAIIISYLQTFNKEVYHLNEEGIDVLLVDHYILEQMALLKTTGYHLSHLLPYTHSLIKPDIEIVIDIPVADSLFQNEFEETGTSLDWFKKENIAFMEMLRENFILLPEKHSSYSKYIVDGTMTTEEVHEDIYHIVKDNLLE